MNWWYKIVAKPLLLECDEWRSGYQAMKVRVDNQRDVIVSMQGVESRLVKTNKELVAKVQELTPQIHGDMRCVLSAREHAASQRIRELEYEVQLKQQEISRLRTKLLKFNQR